MQQIEHFLVVRLRAFGWRSHRASPRQASRASARTTPRPCPISHGDVFPFADVTEQFLDAGHLGLARTHSLW